MQAWVTLGAFSLAGAGVLCRRITLLLSDGLRGLVDARNTRRSLSSGTQILSFPLALSGTHVWGDTVPDLVTGSCMRQLSIVEPRLVKVEYPADTYSYNSHMSDTEPSSQWMAENPNFRLLGILTGRVPELGHSLCVTQPLRPTTEPSRSCYRCRL